TPVRVGRVATQRPDALRERYLRELWDDCVTLKTTTFKAATGQEAPELELSAVFTDLDVLEVDLRDLDDKAAQSGGRAGHEERRQPALAVLSNHPKLVLLGDPGSGKSTLVDFVTLCLAGDWLRFSDVNLKRLGSAWTLPRLLPLRVILRDYAARGQPNGRSLWQFVQDELAATQTSGGENLAACAGVIEEALRQPDGAILLLDGVDEVPDAHNRRFQLKEAIEQFARDFPHCRVLVTSRPYAYQKGKERFTGFEQRTLADFNLEQMQAFIEKWYAHVGEKDQRLGPDKATAYAEKLQREVKNRPRLQDLAANPLLMALMAWLHRQGEGGALPEKRQLLYEKSVEHLLDLWQREKPLYDEQGRLKGQEYDVFTELGIPPDKLRQALNLLAFEAHRDQPDLVGTHDIAAERLVGVLYQEASDEGKAKGPQRIIEYVTNRAGLLIERSQGRVYRFPHRTFQEYLAACHLTGPDFPYTLYDCLRGHDERWREAVLLAAAKAVGGADAAIWTLIAVFCPHDWPPPDPPVDPDWYAVLRAAQALIATEQHHRVPERQRFLVDRLRLWLAQLLDSPQALANAPLDR
ncbi:MAG: NACHT domain-containing protein, partial [Anaerolineae bacterium]